MACRVQDSGVWSAMELIAERGFKGLPAALGALIIEAMRLERERHLGAAPWERTAGRRTTNALERVNRELKRRTRVATLFPNEVACLRLVTAVAMEISAEWVTGKVYPTMA